MLLVGWQEGHLACKKLGAGVVISLERGADMYIAQLMPLPLTVPCLSKIQIALPFWYQLTRVVPDKGPLSVCVCVCCWWCIRLGDVMMDCYVWCCCCYRWECGDAVNRAAECTSHSVQLVWDGLNCSQLPTACLSYWPVVYVDCCDCSACWDGVFWPATQCCVLFTWSAGLHCT